MRGVFVYQTALRWINASSVGVGVVYGCAILGRPTNRHIEMKNSFKKTLKLFKYSSIIFTVVFWISLIIDDYVLFEKRGVTLEGIGLCFLWFLVYFFAFTIYYWAICTAIIVIYFKVMKRTKIS